MIEERRTNLQADGHARSIDLRQEVIRKVGQLIGKHHPVQEVCRLAAVQDPSVLVLDRATVHQEAVRLLPRREESAIHISHRVGAHEAAQLVHPLAGQTLARNSGEQSRRNPVQPIPRRGRHASDTRGHKSPYAPRKAVDARQHARAVEVPVVAGKQLVSTVPRQRDGDMLASQLRDEKRRKL